LTKVDFPEPGEPRMRSLATPTSLVPLGTGAGALGERWRKLGVLASWEEEEEEEVEDLLAMWRQ